MERRRITGDLDFQLKGMLRQANQSRASPLDSVPLPRTEAHRSVATIRPQQVHDDLKRRTKDDSLGAVFKETLAHLGVVLLVLCVIAGLVCVLPVIVKFSLK